MREKRIFLIGLFVGIVLLVPLIAMQFTESVNWSMSDFIMGGLLLFGMGLLLDFTERRISNFNYKVPVMIGVILLFVLIWADLAVGIFGMPWSGD